MAEYVEETGRLLWISRPVKYEGLFVIGVVSDSDMFEEIQFSTPTAVVGMCL